MVWKLVRLENGQIVAVRTEELSKPEYSELRKKIVSVVNVEKGKTTSEINISEKYRGKKYVGKVLEVLEKARKKYDEYVQKLKSQGKIVFTESEWKKTANKSAFFTTSGKLRPDVVIVKDKESYLKEVEEKGIEIKPVKKVVSEVEKTETEKRPFMHVKTAHGIMKIPLSVQASVSKEELKKQAEEQGFMIKEVQGKLEAVPIVQEYEVTTPEGKYKIIKNIKTGETKYVIGKAVWTEKEISELAKRPEFTWQRIMSLENPFAIREISTYIGGVISGQTDRALKEIGEFQRQMVIRSLLRAQQGWKGTLKNVAEAGGLTAASIGIFATGAGAFGTTAATALDVGFAGMGAYTVSQSLPVALETKSPTAIGEVLVGTSMIAAPIIGKLPIGKKSVTLELRPTNIALDLYKRPVRKGEFIRTGRVKIKTDKGVVLEGYLLERETKTTSGRTVKERYIELKEKTVKIGGQKVKIPEQKIGIKDVEITSQTLFERKTPLEQEVLLSKKYVSPEVIIADKELIPRIHGTKETIHSRVFALGEEAVRVQRKGEKIIRTEAPEKPVTDLTSVKYREVAFKTEKEFLGSGTAKILKDGDKAFREIKYAVREQEEKMLLWDTLVGKVRKIRSRIEAIKGRIYRRAGRETAKIQREKVEVKPEKIFEEGDNVLLKAENIRTKEDILKAENILEKMETARRLGETEMKLKGAVNTGNLGRILAFSPLRLIERAGIIGLHRKEKIMLKEKEKTVKIKKSRMKIKRKEKILEDIELNLLDVNPLAEMEIQRTKEKLLTSTKITPVTKEIPNFFEPEIPLEPKIKTKPPLLPLIFPSITQSGRTKRIYAKKGVIKRQFASPEELLEAPLSILSPAGMEEAKKKKKSSGRKKRIHL